MNKLPWLRNIRIKLPNDYQVKDGPILHINEPMTLKDYEKNILQDAVKRFASVNQWEIEARKRYIEHMLFYGIYKPSTKWQRFRKDIKQRFKDIWTIVSGGDVHKNCDY